MPRTATKFSDTDVLAVLTAVRDDKPVNLSNFLMVKHFQLDRGFVSQEVAKSGKQGRPRLKWVLTPAGADVLAKLENTEPVEPAVEATETVAETESEQVEAADTEAAAEAEDDTKPDAPEMAPVAVVMAAHSKAQNVAVLAAVQAGTKPPVDENDLESFYASERGYVQRAGDAWELTPLGVKYLKLSGLRKSA